MNNETEQVFDYLKGKGKVSGGTVRSDLELSRTQWTKIKLELAELGLVELGRGRGGTIKLLTDEKPPEEKKISKAERMAHAREEKESRSKEQKNLDKKRERMFRLAQLKFPDVEIDPIRDINPTQEIIHLRLGKVWNAFRYSERGS